MGIPPCQSQELSLHPFDSRLNLVWKLEFYCISWDNKPRQMRSIKGVLLYDYIVLSMIGQVLEFYMWWNYTPWYVVDQVLLNMAISLWKKVQFGIKPEIHLT